jgi:hypothetical protein
MHSLIDEAKRIPSIERIVFTGGECFLLGRDLDALIAHANELMLQTRVITNGYWAIGPDAAGKRVAALHAAGLTEMMLSTGSFHQRFVPVERVVHAARAAAAARIPVRVAIEVCDQQTFDEALLGDELADEIATRRVFLGHDPWTEDAAGRGTTTLSHDGLLAQGGADRAEGRCSQMLDTITVTPDLQLLGCCGFPMEQLPQLRIGSLDQYALDDVLRVAPNELLKMWLHVAGPRAIADFVATHVPGFKLPSAVSICQSCVALQRDPRAMAAIAEHGGDMVQTIADAFISLNGGLEPLRAF